jgi:hypothetical protein
MLLTALLILTGGCSSGSDDVTAPAAGGAAAAAARVADAGARPPIALTGGAPSIDELLDEFLTAVEQRDKDALHRLRLTRAEYTEIIVPGEVPKGQPPRQTFEQVNDVFWGMLDTKSRYTADAIVNDFGGRHYVERTLELTYRNPREWAWYTGHGEVRLRLRDETGRPYELRTGWIAEVDGRFKFIGFNWDD